MDFNAIGCLRIEGGNQFLYRWRPAAEVAAEIVAQGVPVFGQTGGQRNIKEEIETSLRHRHQRDALAFADEGGPLIRWRNALIDIHQSVPVDITGIAAFGLMAKYVGAQRRAAAVGDDQKITVGRGPVAKPDGDAVGIFLRTGYPFTKLHRLAPPKIEHLSLQFAA